MSSFSSTRPTSKSFFIFLNFCSLSVLPVFVIWKKHIFSVLQEHIIEHQKSNAWKMKRGTVGGFPHMMIWRAIFISTKHIYPIQFLWNDDFNTYFYFFLIDSRIWLLFLFHISETKKRDAMRIDYLNDTNGMVDATKLLSLTLLTDKGYGFRMVCIA